MNVYSIENGEITVEYSSDQPNRTDNNREEENAAETRSYVEENPVYIMRRKTKPMNPTPL